MQFQTPTIASLMAAALRAAKARTELLLLLAALSGIVTSIIYAPAMEVLQNFMAAYEDSGSSTQATEEAARIFEEGVSTLLFGHLAATAVASFLLIPFARASAPGGLVPGGGGASALWVRGLRSFLHLVAASGVTMLLVLLAVPILTVIGSAMGSVGSAVIVAGICLIIWAAFALTGMAHLAIAAEARDRRETLPSAFVRARFFMAPIAGSLALLFLAMMFVDLVFGTLVLALMPAAAHDTVRLILSGAVLYITSALHVAALYIVPDFRDLRPAE